MTSLGLNIWVFGCYGVGSIYVFWRNMETPEEPNTCPTQLIMIKAQNKEKTTLFQKLYVLLKALPPVCMKYTARGEN